MVGSLNGVGTTWEGEVRGYNVGPSRFVPFHKIYPKNFDHPHAQT